MAARPWIFTPDGDHLYFRRKQDAPGRGATLNRKNEEKVKAFPCTFYLLMPPEKETSWADFVGGKVRSKFNVKPYQIASIQTKAPTFPLC